MRRFNISPTILIGAAITLLFGFCIYLRISVSYEQVFGSEWIKFTGIDAYYYMRQIDNLVHNFPQLNFYDPFMRYPEGYFLNSLNFFMYFLGGTSWIIGLGSPTQHTLDMVAVYFPAIIGSISIIPVYFIGKNLFNRWVGLLAAGSIALFTGEFFNRSVLGFTDRDSLEVLLFALVMMFFIMALKNVMQKQLTLGDVRDRNWRKIVKPALYSALAGFFLGIYLITWIGAFIFVLVIVAFLIIQFIADHLKQRNSDYLCFIGTITLLIPLLIFAPASPSITYLIPMIIALLVPTVMLVISRLFVKRSIKSSYYPIGLVILGLAGIGVFYLISPSLFNETLERALHAFMPTDTRMLISEMRPILFPQNDFTLEVVWNNFTTNFFLSFISLGIIGYHAFKKWQPETVLFFVWSLIALILTLIMRRLELFLAINIAVLNAYLIWRILEYVYTRFIKSKAVEALPVTKKERKRALRRRRQQQTISPLNRNFRIGTLGIVVFFLFLFPNITRVLDLSGRVFPAPNNAWSESLTWLKENTPEPFEDSEFYYESYDIPFSYPESAYSVAAWWDYGYWIIRIGHRLPSCDPGGGQRDQIGKLLAAQDENTVDELARDLNAQYLIIDNAVAMRKFHAVATYAGRDKEDFYENYYQIKDGKLSPITLFYPEFYTSLSTRLYFFGGQETMPENSVVISYEERNDQGSQPYKLLTGSRTFDSYDEAQAYIDSQSTGNYRIIGYYPFTTPIPLEPVDNYQPVYSSRYIYQFVEPSSQPGSGVFPYIQIFQYQP